LLPRRSYRAMPLLSVLSLCVQYQSAQGVVRAVDDVSFDLEPGETLGLVGESGCGKSTLGKAIMRLVPTADGRVFLGGEDMTSMQAGVLKASRKSMQMIFQDPYGSLNPRQRLGIARALALRPKVIICDEPVSALDVSVRAQVINLLEDLQQATGVSYLFISHDLSVVEHISDRLIVMYLGRIVETGRSEDVWDKPAHPYTQVLLAAAPIADPRTARSHTRSVLQGELPSPLNPPPGCSFSTRCPYAQPLCREERPILRDVSGGRKVACHYDLLEQPAALPRVARVAN
jgi:peptide/nickel transport system ATP-binding protein